MEISERKQAEKLLADYNRALEMQGAERTLELEREIVERKGAQEGAIAANRAKSTFGANMSHELRSRRDRRSRSPLNAILGFYQLMSLSPCLPPSFSYGDESGDRCRIQRNRTRGDRPEACCPSGLAPI